MSTFVSGNNPANDKGKFFSRNMWWWPPLWLFTCDVAGLPEDLVIAGAYNDGDGLDEQGALDIAKVLRSALADGCVDEFKKGLADAVASTPDETCSLCDGTGNRIVSGNPCACTGCSGTGKTWRSLNDYPFVRRYLIRTGKIGLSLNDNPFERELVIELAEFLENCGGFQIWGQTQSVKSVESLHNEKPDTGMDASKDDPANGTPNTGTDVGEDAPARLFLADP